MILEVDPAFRDDPHVLDRIYVTAASSDAASIDDPASGISSAASTRPRRSVPLSTFARVERRTGAARDHPSGPVPGGRRSRSTCRPAPRSARRSRRCTAASAPSACPNSITTNLAGAAAEFATSLTSEPLLILAAIVTVYIVLGVLYESFIHPITILSTLPSAGVGALLALMLCGADLDLISLIGIILLIGIVKKNAIMMVDFALDAERQRRTAAGAVDPSGLPAALSADHDDDDGGAARRVAAGARQRHRIGAAPAARHRHRRRPAPVASS